MSRIITLLSVSTLLIACGTNVTKEISCTGNNWTELGYETATAGRSVRTFDTYKRQCPSLGDDARESYLDGYTKGIMEHCTYDNGYVLGERNAANSNACPPELRAQFNRGYAHGNNALKIKIKRMEDLSEGNDRNTQDRTNEVTAGGGGAR